MDEARAQAEFLSQDAAGLDLDKDIDALHDSLREIARNMQKPETIHEFRRADNTLRSILDGLAAKTWDSQKDMDQAIEQALDIQENLRHDMEGFCLNHSLSPDPNAFRASFEPTAENWLQKDVKPEVGEVVSITELQRKAGKPVLSDHGQNMLGEINDITRKMSDMQRERQERELGEDESGHGMDF